jgi:hypothetical protein
LTIAIAFAPTILALLAPIIGVTLQPEEVHNLAIFKRDEEKPDAAYGPAVKVHDLTIFERDDKQVDPPVEVQGPPIFKRGEEGR